MNILVYDIQHHETLDGIIRILSVKGIHTDVFTTDRIRAELEGRHSGGQVTWHVVEEKKPFGHAFRLYQLAGKNTDIIILNSIYQHHVLFFLTNAFASVPVFLMVHDTNQFTPPFVFSARSIVRYLGMKLLNRTVDGFLALSSATRQSILDKHLTNKPVIVVPGSVFMEAATPRSDRYVITIPGSIEANRRNYMELAELVALLHPHRTLIELVILGPAKNNRYADALKEKLYLYKTDGLAIRFFEKEFIPQEEFDEWLKRTDLIYLPLCGNAVVNGVIHSYGHTRISGGFFDAVRFGIPMAVPELIPLPPELKDQSVQYTSLNELAEQINKAITEKEYRQELRERAIANARTFEADAVRKKFFSDLQQVTKKEFPIPSST